MAGGRGSRLKLSVEKPLLRVYGASMLECVVAALKDVRKVGRIIVAVSQYTPKTAELAKKLELEVIETPGKGYVEDMRWAIMKLRLKHTIVIAADLPFIKSTLIKRVLRHYARVKKPALAIVVPARPLEDMGLKMRYKFRVKGVEVAPTGINILNGSVLKQSHLDQEIYIESDFLSLLNINTLADFRCALKVAPLLGIGGVVGR